MRILIDLHILPAPFLPSSNVFLVEMITEMARRHSEHSFIFLAPALRPGMADLPGHITFQYVNSKRLKWLSKKIWYNYVLPREIAASKADLYVTADNLFVRKAMVPSCLFLMHSIAFIQGQSENKKNKRSAILLSRAIKNAGTLITFSESDRDAVQHGISDVSDKLRLLRMEAPDIAELKWTEKEMLKIEFAGGVEYFVFAGDLHERYDLVELLKAFTLFKKWQQSNMQLLLVGNRSSSTEEFTAKLANYKHRNDVRLLVDQPTEVVERIIGAAYAFVYPALYDHFPVNILKAMRAGVPVISTPLTVCMEWASDNVMYPETNDAAGFARSMLLLYKDEKLRSEFIASAKNLFSLWEKTDIVDECLKFFEESITK